MRYLFVLLLFLNTVLCNHVLAQKNNKENHHHITTFSFKKCSATTIRFLADYKSIDTTNAIKYKKQHQDIIDEYGIDSIKGEEYISVFIQMDDTLHCLQQLATLGVQLNGTKTYIMTALIPVKNIEKVLDIPCVANIEIGDKVFLNDDSSRSQSKSNLVNQGFKLPQAYKGKGVIVGIIDEGFDLTHPNFYDSTGTTYRIKRFWNQVSTTTMPPTGFSYGALYSTQQQMLALKTDDVTQTHGSHTTGIATGSGYGKVSKYQGIAPEADIALVRLDFTNSTRLLDAIQYLLQYADSVGKPISINMSLGSLSGPHDGTSTFAVKVDTLFSLGTKAGKFISCSMGNAGTFPIHFRSTHVFPDTAHYTFFQPPPIAYRTNSVKTLTINMYGRPNKFYKCVFGIYNLITKSFDDSSIVFDSTYINKSVNDTLSFGANRIPYNITMSKVAPNNNEQSAVLKIDSFYQTYYYLDTTKIFAIKLISKDNDINGWLTAPTSNGQSVPIFYNAGLSNIINGDIFKTSTDQATDRSIISVGSFNSGYGITAGNLSNYSSRGNTADNRIKPDITASGNRVTSSFNTWCTSLVKSDITDSFSFNAKYYPYGLDQGTSMSSPVVAGVMALWLQANPHLTLNQAKLIMQNTSTIDNYTVGVPNSNWGYGKINAWDGLKYLLPYYGNDTSTKIICSDATANISNLYTLPSYVTEKWDVADSTAAGFGVHKLIIGNNIGTYDTLLINVTQNVARWLGTNSSNWHDPLNWDIAKVPNDSTHVIIIGTTPNSCIISNADATAASVHVYNGASFAANNNHTLAIKATCSNLPAVADFSYIVTGSTFPKNVSFINNSTGAVSYYYDFGDGTNSTASSPSHAYNSAGTYKIILTATGVGGSSSKSITITL